jgi:hypothetical protein
MRITEFVRSGDAYNLMQDSPRRDERQKKFLMERRS